MPYQFSRIAQRTALCSLIASCLTVCPPGMAQEPFILIPSSPSGQTDANGTAGAKDVPKADRPKQRIPNIPTEPHRDLPNDSARNTQPNLALEEPPLLKFFPASPSKSNAINDDGVLMLGRIDTSAGDSTRGAPKSIAPINDHLPVVRSSPQVQETEDAEIVKLNSPSDDPIDVIPSLSLPWQLANASSFPFSPIHLWQGIRREPAVPKPQLMAQSPPGLEPLKIDNNIAISTKLEPNDNIASPSTTTAEQNDSAHVDTKPRRNVRIPFGDEETAVADEPVINRRSDSTPPSLLTELEEQKGQEAPIIDSKSLDRAKDEQGADALQAAKPATPPKRKIKIDDPQTDGQIVPAKPNEAPVVINAADALRLRRVQACLDHYLNFPESTSVRSPWAVMHALLPFGGDYEMVHGNQRVNAIGWMCHNGTCRTQRIFTPSRNGFIPNIGGGVQGHAGQFMAILAQCGVPLDYPIQVGNRKYKVEDLVRYEMATCREKSELTFKLIGLSYYLDSNKQWRSTDGKVWSIPKLISEELSQPIKGAACGGTHRLMGYSFAVKQRMIQGLPIDGQYARADKFVKDYVEYAWKLQNPDGSFSTSWLEGRGNEPNEERKVQTTGHILEWLLFTIPDSEVNTPKVQKSIDFLLTKIYDKKEYKWPIGPRGHATRAVSLYLNRFDEIKMTKPELLRVDTKTASPRNSEPFYRR